jgi:hypothetical protein
MSFGIPVRNGLGVGLLASTFLSSLRIGGRPALALNFVNTTTLDSRITFARSTTATFTGSNGLIQSSAIDTPRFEYDPVTLQLKGFLLEQQRVNSFVNSLINGTSLTTQSVTVTATPYTISFYGTGSITLTGAFSATVTGTGVYPNRQTLTFTPTAGVLICTVLGSVQYAQLEAGAFVTTFIPTAGAAVTRASDLAQMTGTNFSSWYNAAQGTLVIEGEIPPSVDSSTGNYFATISDGTTTSSIAILEIGGTRGQINSSGTTTFTSTVGAEPTGVVKAALAYSATSTILCVGGTLGSLDTAVTIPTVDRLAIGIRGDLFTGSLINATSANGTIRSIAYYNTRLTNTQIQALTV